MVNQGQWYVNVLLFCFSGVLETVPCNSGKPCNLCTGNYHRLTSGPSTHGILNADWPTDESGQNPAPQVFTQDVSRKSSTVKCVCMAECSLGHHRTRGAWLTSGSVPVAHAVCGSQETASRSIHVCGSPWLYGVGCFPFAQLFSPTPSSAHHTAGKFSAPKKTTETILLK